MIREVEGPPKGSVKNVVDAFGELVDEGCLVVLGPNISDNAVPTREAIEERFRVPAISVTGSDDWLGEWTFASRCGWSPVKTHFRCPGAPLARAEGRISMNLFLDRMRDIRIDDCVHGRAGDRRYTVDPTFILRGLSDLHMRFTPGREGSVTPYG